MATRTRDWRYFVLTGNLLSDILIVQLQQHSPIVQGLEDTVGFETPTPVTTSASTRVTLGSLLLTLSLVAPHVWCDVINLSSQRLTDGFSLVLGAEWYVVTSEFDDPDKTYNVFYSEFDEHYSVFLK